jgi:Leucine rich repeat
LGLVGTIPSTIGKLTLLESLQLQNNDFTGSIPPAFKSLSNLIDINLSSNNLSGQIEGVLFQSWANVINVWFQNNRLTGSIPSSIGSMKRCEVVFLSDNRLSDSIPKSVGNMTSLQVLMLHNNELTGDISNSLLSSDSLLRLYVTNNTHLYGNISLIRTRSPINEMALTNTSISGAIPKALCRFHHYSVHYEIDCQNDSISNKPKIQCNCCLSYDGSDCPAVTWLPDS